jgi:hypothetical protein
MSIASRLRASGLNVCEMVRALVSLGKNTSITIGRINSSIPYKPWCREWVAGYRMGSAR